MKLLLQADIRSAGRRGAEDLQSKQNRNRKIRHLVEKLSRTVPAGVFFCVCIRKKERIFDAFSERTARYKMAGSGLYFVQQRKTAAAKERKRQAGCRNEGEAREKEEVNII